MKKLQRLFVAFLSLCLLICCVACGGGDGGGNNGGGGGGAGMGRTEMENIRSMIVSGSIDVEEGLSKWDQTGTVTKSSCKPISANETEAVFEIRYLYRDTLSRAIGELTWSNVTNSFSFEGRYIVNNDYDNQINVTVVGLAVDDCFTNAEFHISAIPLSSCTFDPQPADVDACVALIKDAINECFSGQLGIIGTIYDH